ncbi:MAG: alpha/beta hydrolase family protein [Candidatus Merdivicinus sp.]|jgi:hypothetical protein
MKEYIFYTEDQHEAYICLPDSSSKQNAAILVLHGSGRGSESYRNEPFYRYQRDIILKSGCIFAVVSNGLDTFGTEIGMKRIEWLYDLLLNKFHIHPTVGLFCTSAGGMMMHRYFRMHPDQVALMISVFAIFDPETQPALESFRKAYQASNEEELRRKIQFPSPVKQPLGFYRNIRAVILHGREDHVVPVSQSLEFCKKVLEDGGTIKCIITDGGHSTTNFALYETDEILYELVRFHKNITETECNIFQNPI